MQKLLTIVVPVYKVEPYINKCLDSCLIYKTDEQGNRVLDAALMNQLEVIIVNDGTPDRSAEMSREYVKRYPQTFRQIDKENGGHGSAWNVGLKQATGKYLRFLDSDDWLTNLDKLMEKLQECDADIVLTPKKEIIGNTEKIPCQLGYEGGIVKDIVQFDFETNYPMTIMSFQYATYRKCIFSIKDFAFREHCSYDDTILFTAPLLNAKTYVIYDFVVYNYLLGRENQSADPIVARKNIPSRIENLEYMTNYFYANKTKSINSHIEKNASVIISRLAAFLLCDIHYMPYKDAKQYASLLIPYLKNPFWRPPKSAKRLVKHGFTIWYFFEKIKPKTVIRPFCAYKAFF